MYIAISFLGLSASRNRSCATTSVAILSSTAAGDEDDALLQEPREDVVGALAAVGLLDHHRNEVHVGFDGIAHGVTWLGWASVAVSRAFGARRGPAVLLQDRDTFVRCRRHIYERTRPATRRSTSAADRPQNEQRNCGRNRPPSRARVALGRKPVMTALHYPRFAGARTSPRRWACRNACPGASC